MDGPQPKRLLMPSRMHSEASRVSGFASTSPSARLTTVEPPSDSLPLRCRRESREPRSAGERSGGPVGHLFRSEPSGTAPASVFNEALRGKTLLQLSAARGAILAQVLPKSVSASSHTDWVRSSKGPSDPCLSQVMFHKLPQPATRQPASNNSATRNLATCNAAVYNGMAPTTSQPAISQPAHPAGPLKKTSPGTCVLQPFVIRESLDMAHNGLAMANTF